MSGIEDIAAVEGSEILPGEGVIGARFFRPKSVEDRNYLSLLSKFSDENQEFIVSNDLTDLKTPHAEVTGKPLSIFSHNCEDRLLAVEEFCQCSE